MRAADIVCATTITKVWVALGGDLPKRGRARAFYRDGDNPQVVSLNDAKACWFDHRDQVGGGVLDLIQRVLGCDRRAALGWLSGFTGLPLESRPLTAADRRRYACARREAAELVDWKERLVDALKGERRRWWHIYHAARTYILRYGFDSALSELMATLYEFAEEEADRLQKEIDTLIAASFADLLPIFREQKWGTAA